MINEKKTITYNPFEPLFSVLSQKDSNGCNLEQRSNLMLRAVSISKDCVFWAPVGVTFVQSESCIYARKVVNKNVVINKKFFIDQDLKNSLTAFKKAVAKAVLDAVRSLQNAIFEYENCKCNHVNPSSNLRATLKVRLDKEKSINYIPRITVTINFSGSERVSKVVSRTLNKFHSRSFMKLVTQFVSYKNQCIDSGKVLPIKIPDIRVTNSDIELLAERSQSLFEHALTAYLSNVIEDTNEIRGKVIPAKDAFSIEYDHGLEKSYNFKKYFNDQNICLLVARICDFHMSHSAKNKTELDHYKLNKNSNCLDKIQRSSGLKGIIVALDRKGLSIVIHGIVGKHSNGSYKTKQKRVIDGKLKDAFNYAIDAHNEAFKLSSLSKTQYNVAYATLQLSILTKVPAPYLSSMDSCLEGVSSVVPIKCKMFNEHLPHFSLACKAVTTTPFKKTGICGVNVQVNNSSSYVSATVSMSKLRGRINQSFSIKKYGLFLAFEMAIVAYRAGFNLPILTECELEELYGLFKENVYLNTPKNLHFKLNGNSSTESPLIDASISNDDKITNYEHIVTTQEDAMLISASLREKKDELLKITISRSDGDKFFGILSPVEVEVLTNCSACSHKYIESHDESGFSVVCSSCTRGSKGHDKRWKARLDWNLLNCRDISSSDIPHFNLTSRKPGDNFEYVNSARSYFVATLELIQVQMERNDLIRRFKLPERRKKIAGRGYQELMEAYLKWSDISLKVIEKERYLN